MDRPTALLNKFSNKSECVKNHLKKYQHFISKVGGIEAASRILDIELKELSEDVKAKKRCIEPNLSTGGRILNNEVKKYNINMVTKLKNDFVGPTLIFNSWTNVVNQNIMGSVFIISKEEVLIWKRIDISSKRERYKEVVEKIEIIFADITQIGIKLNAIVCDNALSYTTLLKVYCFSVWHALLLWKRVGAKESTMLILGGGGIFPKVLSISKLRASITYQHRSNKELKNQLSEDKTSEDEESEDIQELEDNILDEHIESFNYLIDEWENLLAQEVEAN
ncbi:41452_t:CDS:2 [Gigaspora margarita]|uniref:41452_t:CDS:1 n=1 Tax=Gigaspora margarita TaxID=4874 RepID=A0ABM8VVS3_GIGMA|nr:41452_t:CDS:2 [Gigaspora margarita]